MTPPDQIAPARVSEILSATEKAARAIPPAFPLDATVAVNPFLGQTGEDLATAAARFRRVAGIRVTPERARFAAKIAAGEITSADLAAALASAPEPKPADVTALRDALDRDVAAPKALPTVADLAAQATGTDWPALIERTIGLWAGGRFDRGQALWPPAPGASAFASWQEWATHDLTPEIAGLTDFCTHVANAPDTPERAIMRAAETLGLTGAAAETAFHRLLITLGGWAQHARWLLWQAELAGGRDTTIVELLAIRLVWEEALFLHLREAIGSDWAATAEAHAAPVTAGEEERIDSILQTAAERAQQRRLTDTLAKSSGTAAKADGRPALQAAFCIDVRSEVFRRALESLDGRIETIGFAGFFGLPVCHRDGASDLDQAHLPVLLNAAFTSTSAASPEADAEQRITARATRAWGRFRQAAVSSFAFVEAAGPLYAVKLVKDALGQKHAEPAKTPAPRLDPMPDAAARSATAAAVLKAMSMTRGHAPLVLLLGHGANVTNNPHASAYHCGACGGHTGEVSARLLAALLNDPETRAGLPAHGIELPEDTRFVAGLHDTTTDQITLWPKGGVGAGDKALKEARSWLAEAGRLARAERAPRLPGAGLDTIEQRARNWAEIRPEWGLAGCSAFIAAPRATSRNADLAGRSFLHSYDWRADEGFGTLELIITAPVVVASWISLQYYGSAVAPDVFGGGNKLIHNVTGGIGVIEGNGGALRAGLPWQAVHDGKDLMHDPLRLSVCIEAPREAIADILARHDDVRALFDNGWLNLFVLEDGAIAARYRPGLRWEPVTGSAQAAA